MTLLTLVDNLHLEMNWGHLILLTLLVTSTAFDIICHGILLDCFQCSNWEAYLCCGFGLKCRFQSAVQVDCCFAS